MKIISVLFIIVLLIWLAGAFYINKNKTDILNTIVTQVNKNINGKLTVGNMEPSLVRGFPGVSVSLKNVELVDSLIHIHKKKLLNAEDINVNLNVLSLIRGIIKVNKIEINDANLYLLTDSNGYANIDLFRKKKSDSTKHSSSALEINKINFNRINFVINNLERGKLFEFNVHEINANVKYPDSGWVGTLKLNTLVKNFAFNTQKGSFLKNKTISGVLSFNYSNSTQKLMINPKTLKIGKYPFTIGATIDLAEKSDAFAISIQVNNILYKDVATMLSPNISSKLLKFDIKQPVNIAGTIVDEGTKKYGDPEIHVNLTARNNIINLPGGNTISDCDFDGFFTNRDTTGGNISDENSTIKFKNLKAKFLNAPFQVDTLIIANLSNPIATGTIKSNFNINNLNESIGGHNIDFVDGQVNVNLNYKADIVNFNFTKPKISGTISVNDANINYKPRKLNLKNSSVNLEFKEDNLTINNGSFKLGKSTLNLDCSIDNFLNLYYTDPNLILVKLNLSSPQLNLGELISLLGQRHTTSKIPSKGNPDFSNHLNNVLELSKMDINLKVKKAVYNKFVAENLAANIAVRGSDLLINKISVQNSGGKVTLNGFVKPSGKNNSFYLNSNISNVNVQKFFYSFDNFGLSSIQSDNLRGFLSSKVRMNGKIDNVGNIIPKTFDGKINLNLNKAALINFEPLVNVGKYVFRSRNLSELKINNLDGTFNIKGDKIHIEPMEINSSAINVNVKGLYSLTNGTDISLEIPLRNPKGDELLDDETKKTVRMNGFVLRLKAVDDNKGGVKLRLDRNRNK